MKTVQKQFFLYEENMKMKVEVKIPCLRKAAGQFSRMQICYVCTVFYALKLNRHENTFMTKNNYSKVHCVWFPIEKKNLSLFYFSKFLVNFFTDH